MEKIGWNYNEEIIDGRNVYFFRNTAHPDVSIQKRIYEEVNNYTALEKFNFLFMEGCFVKTQHSLPSTQIKSKLISKLDCNKELVDNPDLLRQQIEIVKSLVKIYSDVKNGNSSLIELQPTLVSYVHGINSLDEKRERFVVDKILNEMNIRGLNNLGLVYGNSHYSNIKKLLKENDIGCISFFPGKNSLDEKQSFNYASYLASVE